MTDGVAVDPLSTCPLSRPPSEVRAQACDNLGEKGSQEKNR